MADCKRKTANLLDWSGNLSVVNGTVTTNQDVISSMIDVSNINTLYFTGDPNLMNSGVYRLAKSNSIITFGNTVDSYSTDFTGGSYDVSDCNFLLVTVSVYGKPAENRQLIKSSYMCNEGSTPLPYEPYGWVHSLRKLTTSTDTFTTLPADLYADGNNATVGLKGNTVQNGTPTPQNPVDVVGVGELETSGEHSGQYKIPILSNSQTTNVYLGEVETTRNIGKLVFDGTENWALIDTDVVYLTPTVTMAKQLMAICSHYTFLNVPRSELTLNSFTTKGGAGTSLWFKTQYTSTADFKTFLQQQYAAGTPVIVWYVLAEPTTGIVNEPIRKIGYYADTVSGITIPTITSKDTFDVDTTLKPSEVSLSYTGWHDAEVKKWDGSQWV